MYDSHFCLSTRLKVYGGAEQKKSQVGGGGGRMSRTFVHSCFYLYPVSSGFLDISRTYLPCAR